MVPKKNNQEKELQKSLDRYSIKMIKAIGIVGVVMGVCILGVFWFWVLKNLF